MDRAGSWLHVQGAEVVNGSGEPVLLRGFGLGGWMNMENFITGYPANEAAWRQTLWETLGPEKYEFFFERFLTYFFEEEDAHFIRSLGLNLVRLAINYRHFENDLEPFVIREQGFKPLDRAIQLCADQGLYTIIDLHALPGFQNQGWHSDNPTHKAFLWENQHFQDRTVHLWEVIAERYKDNPWIAGYNLINEPADPTGERLMPLYRRLYDAIRAIDPRHLIFLEGNRYSQDFWMFGEPWPDVVYSIHDYALSGFADAGPYPGISRGQYVDPAYVEQQFLRRSAYAREHTVPLWVGEFGPVYRGDQDAIDMRYQVLRDQLEIYDRFQAHWAIWTYKDIGLQGIVYATPDSPYLSLLQPLLEKKARLGADAWGSVDTEIRDVMQPLEDLMDREFPTFDPFPFGSRWLSNRLVRHILFAEPLLSEFGALFGGLDEASIDQLLQSFRFNNCLQRTQLANILQQHAPLASSR